MLPRSSPRVTPYVRSRSSQILSTRPSGSPPSSFLWRPNAITPTFAFRTHYPGPRFTFGERPYLYSGGEFRFDSNGSPLLDGWDDMRLSVCTPYDLDNPPPGGWPVVIYQHGTGGDYDGFCNSNRYAEVSSRLASNGIIGVGIDQPLHGSRTVQNTVAPDLAHFNLVNPYASRSNFRQGALDAIYLAHALADQPVTLKTDDGTPIPLNQDKIMFMGRPQGGITGAIALPFMGDDIQSAMPLGGRGLGDRRCSAQRSARLCRAGPRDGSTRRGRSPA